MSQPLTLRTEEGDELIDLPEFEARVRRGEVSPQSLVKFPPVTGDTFVQACDLPMFQALHEPRRAYFSRAFRFSKFPWITSALIFVNLSVYVFTVRQGPLDLDAMVRFGGKAGPLILDLGEFWRLFTANFLHRNALHIGLNMFVLFNVGGALENAYRPLDYLWLLFVSGLATMTASLLLADAVSVGASGMVYGALGAVVIFGLKYRSILPSRYRRVLAEAAIPIVLIFLWIGWTSVGVDNSAHLGGLLAGLCVAPFLRPRLLEEKAPSKWGPMLKAAPAFAMIAVLVSGDALFAGQIPLLTIRRDDKFGISVPVPNRWRRGANRLGQLAYNNGLPDLGRATFAAEAVVSREPADAALVAARFVAEDLQPKGVGEGVLKVRPSAPRPARLGDRDALVVKATFDETFGTTHLLAYFVPRGDVVYRLVFTYPDAYPAYERVVEQMVSGMRFDEPESVRQARALALLFPNAAWSWGELGESLRRIGESAQAADALRVAVKAEPSNVIWRSQLALSLLQAGQIEEGCKAADDAVLYGPRDIRALEVAARCELSRGDSAAALLRLHSAREVAPQDERLKAAEDKLRASLAEKQP